MSSPELDFHPKGFFINDEWAAPTEGRTLRVINPSNGERLPDVPQASAADVDRAVTAAVGAFPRWSRIPVSQRARCVELLAKRIEEHATELALIDTMDSGNAISGMATDMQWAVESLRFFAGLATEIKGETQLRGPGHLNFTLRQPYGVVAKINPFNHPFRFCAEKIAAPLVAGNCVVVKGSEQAPLSSLRLGELCEGLFPPGVVNILTGDGRTGDALVRHPGISRIGFVGSVPTGIAIARAAAETLKVATFELGGKNPLIIFPDADPVKAATAAVRGMNMNRQGQSCSSTSRVLVHASLHKPVLEELVRQVEALPIGLPWLEKTEVGPVVSELQFKRVKAFIRSGMDEGAELVCGGGHPSAPELRRGYFVEPAIFDGVRPEMRIAREEIFGPVMSVMTWSNYEEMLSLANGVEYGLTAAIVTGNLAGAMETAERIEAGYVWINSSGRYLGAPYGGWKLSGIGREECLDELISYSRIKNINLRW